MLTTPQVARMAERSVRTVHRAVDDGELTPAMQAGEGGNAPYLFERAEVERWLAEREQKKHERIPA
jgi:hypothetical protein